jgi:hypothetical protein
MFGSKGPSMNTSSLYITRSQTHECGNCHCGRAIPFLGIFISNFLYWFFAVRNELRPSTEFLSLFSLKYFSLYTNGFMLGFRLYSFFSFLFVYLFIYISIYLIPRSLSLSISVHMLLIHIEAPCV